MILWKQIGVLHYRNVCIRKHQWLATTLEILLPTAVFALLAYINSRNKLQHITRKETIYPEYTARNVIKDGFWDFGGQVDIIYTPQNSATNTVITEMKSILQDAIPRKREFEFNVTGMSCETDMVDEFLRKFKETQWSVRAPGFGIHFSNLNPATPDELPANIEYVIRPVSDMFPTEQLFAPSQTIFYGSSQTYRLYGFLAINWALNEAILSLSIRNTAALPKVLIEEFPLPASSRDVPMFTLLDFLPACCFFIVALNFVFLLKNVISEKETGARELMKMMGLKGWMNWLGWTMAVLMTQIFSVTICVALLVVSIFGPPILKSSPTLVWVYLILYGSVAICYSFFLCPLFKRPTVAICVASILWAAAGTAYRVQMSDDSSFKFLDKYLFVLPNIALNRGWESIRYFEERGGAGWCDLFTNPADQKTYPLAVAFGSFILQCFVFGILAWYLDAVRPGPYGIPKSFLFFTKKYYWLPSKALEKQTDVWGSEINRNFELAPRDLNPGIQVRGLKKSFEKSVAVNNIFINFYEGEITALLGHNGAGKTTTMSMLTGMIPADSGKVIVDGYNIFDNINEFRKNLGLCPQHNLLFSCLTVLEHLTFFGLLKGLSKAQAHSEAMHLMDLQNMKNKMNTLPDKLSGGMKRKLSLAIALIGSPKILMLDEPTSGMDPESRREMWNLLLSIRGERTIILTTHFMEEADVLGDRIAIMDHGQIMCFGTSIMLKNLYGAGYYLNILKKRDAVQNQDLITSAIQEFIPEAELKSDEGPKISYIIPTESVDGLPDMFEHLETVKDALGIASVAVACTTLEEVFLKVGEIAAEERDGAENGKTDSQEHSEIQFAEEDYKKLKFPALLWQQLTALMKKKLIYSKRRRGMYIIFGLIPLLASLFSNLLLNGQKDIDTSGPPPLKLHPESYKSMQMLYRSPDSNPFTSQLEHIVSPQSAVKISSNVDINDYLLSLAKRDRNEYSFKNMMALDLNSSAMLVLNNPVAAHAAPISLNVAYNLILKTAVGRTISSVNHPISLFNRDFCHMSMDNKAQQFIFQAVVWFQFFSTSLILLMGAFIALPILERINNAKQLQLMTGAPSALYWITIFIVDYMYFILISFLSLLIFISYGNVYIGDAPILFLLTALLGVSGTVFAYVVTYFKKTYAGAFSFYLNLNLFLGTYGAVILFGLMTLNVTVNGKLIDGQWLDVADKILRLLPQYSFNMSLLTFAVIAFKNNDCRICHADSCKILPFFDERDQEISMKSYLNTLILSGVLYLLVISAAESGYLQKSYNFVFVSIFGSEGGDGEETVNDPDVQEERDKVDSTKKHPEHASEQVLLVDRLVKKFRRATAVRGVSFLVRPGECFGLLGVNGAGKTTTFRMLTGDTLPTSGDCSLFSFRLSRSPRDYLAQIGYCPQFDAHNEFFTGNEMLRLFADLRGIHQSQTEREISKWVSTLGLEEYASNLTSTYSGGNKRKLSTAMALIGDPSLVVLDEPTSGVDPISRRRLWDVLIESRKRGQAVIFTSHSMDECETLCDRLTIMVGGQLMCLGNVEYLKQRYAQGYTIQLKLRHTTSSEKYAVKRAVDAAFEGAVLKDEHAGSLSYHVTSPTVALSELFAKMRAIKNTMEVVEYYQVSNTTLEQVFLAFARSEAKIIGT